MKALALAGSVLALTGVLAMSAPQAQAKSDKSDKSTTTTTTTAPKALTCSSGSVTANPLAGGSSVAYSQCLGPISGNDVTSSIDDDLTGFLNTYLGDWSLDAKYEGGKVSSGPNNFGFSWVETSEGKGTWSLSKAVTTPFVISLKAGNKYNSYYVDGTNSTTGGSWATFDAKALSHASFFVRNVPDEPAPVPEPTAAAALVLVGLSAVGLKRK